MADETPNNGVSTTLTANGSTDALRHEGDGLVYYATGTFATANIVIESSADGTTYVVELAAQTEKFDFKIPADTPRGMLIRATMAGATGGESVVITSFKGR